GEDRVARVQDRSSAAMLSHDSFNLQQGSEAHTTQLASSEEDHHDAAGLVGHHTFKGWISSPRLNPHRPDASGKRGWKARLDLGNAGTVGRQIQNGYVCRYHRRIGLAARHRSVGWSFRQRDAIG